MNARTLGLAVLTITLALAFQGANCAHGQTIPILTIREPVLATLSSTPPTNTYDNAWSQEPSDNPNHRFSFNFSGTVANTSPTAAASVRFWLDWLNASDPPGTTPHKTGVLRIELAPSESKVYTEDDSFTSAHFGFIPRHVSIHYENVGPGAPAIIDGVFLREVYALPEPGALAICGVFSTALIAVTRRRKN